MKKIIYLLILCLMIVGCKKKNHYVIEEKNNQVEIKEIAYNQDELNANLSLEVVLDLEQYQLVKCVNDSSNCYEEIEYCINDTISHFENVASYSEVYDIIETTSGEIQMISSKLADHLILNAKDYVNFIQFYRLDNQSYGYFKYPQIDGYQLLANYIVLYNHHYLSSTTEVQKSLSEMGDEEIYLNMVLNQGQVMIQNPDEYLTYHFGQVELFPRYLNLIQEVAK